MAAAAECCFQQQLKMGGATPTAPHTPKIRSTATTENEVLIPILCRHAVKRHDHSNYERDAVSIEAGSQFHMAQQLHCRCELPPFLRSLGLSVVLCDYKRVALSECAIPELVFRTKSDDNLTTMQDCFAPPVYMQSLYTPLRSAARCWQASSSDDRRASLSEQYCPLCLILLMSHSKCKEELACYRRAPPR